MDKALLEYGALGIMVALCVGYILRIETRHHKERKEWIQVQEDHFDRLNQLTDESNKVLREHTNILSGLKILLENKFTR